MTMGTDTWSERRMKKSRSRKFLYSKDGEVERTREWGKGIETERGKGYLESCWWWAEGRGNWGNDRSEGRAVKSGKPENRLPGDCRTGKWCLFAGGAVAVVVVVCVGFLLVLLVVGVLKMRDTPMPRRHRKNRRGQVREWRCYRIRKRRTIVRASLKWLM